jgi:hypothetical protein
VTAISWINWKSNDDMPENGWVMWQKLVRTFTGIGKRKFRDRLDEESFQI